MQEDSVRGIWPERLLIYLNANRIIQRDTLPISRFNVTLKVDHGASCGKATSLLD